MTLSYRVQCYRHLYIYICYICVIYYIYVIYIIYIINTYICINWFLIQKGLNFTHLLHLSFSIYFMKQIICRIQHVEEVLFKNGSRYLLRWWTRYFSLQILLLKSIETFNWTLPKIAVSGTWNSDFNTVIYRMKHIPPGMDQPWKNNRFLSLIEFRMT